MSHTSFLIICRDWQWHGGRNKSRIGNPLALEPWDQPHVLTMRSPVLCLSFPQNVQKLLLALIIESSWFFVNLTTIERPREEWSLSAHENCMDLPLLYFIVY